MARAGRAATPCGRAGSGVPDVSGGRTSLPPAETARRTSPCIPFPGASTAAGLRGFRRSSGAAFSPGSLSPCCSLRQPSRTAAQDGDITFVSNRVAFRRGFGRTAGRGTALRPGTAFGELAARGTRGTRRSGVRRTFVRGRAARGTAVRGTAVRGSAVGGARGLAGAAHGQLVQLLANARGLERDRERALELVGLGPGGEWGFSGSLRPSGRPIPKGNA